MRGWLRFTFIHLLCSMIFLNSPIAYSSTRDIQARTQVVSQNFTRDRFIDVFALTEKDISAENYRMLLQIQKNFQSNGRTKDYKVQWSPAEQRAYVLSPTADGKSEVQIEIPMSDAPELAKFSPRSVSKMMAEVLSSAKPLETMSHTIKRFPAEALTFFIAVGALVSFNLFTNYANNPVALQDHIEHQLSPLGLFGFYLFMYSQGITSNVLSTIIKTPSYRHFIPYLSMTVGFFVQSFATSMIQDCLIPKTGDVDVQACDKAYLKEVVGKRLFELAPSLASMLVATAAAGAIEAGVSKVLFRAGVDVALWFVPGKTLFSGVRALTMHGARIGLFFALDAYFLNDLSSKAWNLSWGSYDFGKRNDELVRSLLISKGTEWQNIDKENAPVSQLSQSLDRFQSDMQKWRMALLSEVMARHQYWQAALNQVVSMHNLSQSLYKRIIDEAIRYQKDPKAINPMLRSYPLYGVTALQLPEEKNSLLYQKPAHMEFQTQSTVIKVASDFIEASLKQSPNLSGLTKEQINQLRVIQSYLSKVEPSEQSQGIKLINATTEKVAANPSGAMDFYYLLQNLQKILGKADPMDETGRGYFSYIAKLDPQFVEAKELKFPKAVGSYRVSNLPEYILMSAACGPNLSNGQLIQGTKGFPYRFTPPSIVKISANEIPFCEMTSDIQDSKSIFSSSVSVKGKNYKSVLEFVTQNLDSRFVADNGSNFESEWNKAITAKMISSFDQFAKIYDVNNALMLKTLNDGGENQFKAGWTELFARNSDVSYKTVESYQQEIRVYLLMLGELFKDSYRLQANKKIPASFYSAKASGPINWKTEMSYASEQLPIKSKQIPLLKTLQESDNLDFNAIANPWKGRAEFESLMKDTARTNSVMGLTYSDLIGTPDNLKLFFQAKIEHEVDNMIWRIRSLRTFKANDGHIVVQGKLAYKDLVEIEKNLDEQLQAIAIMMGVDKAQEPLSQSGLEQALSQNETAKDLFGKAGIQLKGPQRKLAVDLLQKIKASTGDLLNLIKMVNAVNWENMSGLSKQKETKEKIDKYTDGLSQQIQQEVRRHTAPGR